MEAEPPRSMPEPVLVPLDFARRPVGEMRARGRELYADLRRRRSVRAFSPEPVPRDLVETAVRIAGTAPSGAHMQPWRFVVVEEPALKARIRAAAEAEEREFYRHRAPREWLEALAPLGTDEVKTHLTDAPHVVVLFKVRHGTTTDGRRVKHYYATESCGIAAGLFLAAIHRMGLASLTHTPSPMGFLSEVLGRPANEQPFLVMPVGYPAPDARVPDIARKAVDDILEWR